jgi:sporulation protein YlmC with PRC-barrel domain
MKNTALFAAFAAALLAATPLSVSAQTAGTGGQEATPATGGGAIQGRLEPNQVLATNLKGANVYGAGNRKIGTIRDIVLGENGRVVAVVVGINRRNVAVAMRNLRIEKNTNGNGIQRVLLNASAAQLERAPNVDLNGNGSNGAGSGSTGNGVGSGDTGGGSGGVGRNGR